MRLIGGKWKGSILWHLHEGPKRFSVLAKEMPGASSKMISQRLKEMEDVGLVVREIGDGRPVKIHYHITDFGRSSLKVLTELKNWAEVHGV